MPKHLNNLQKQMSVSVKRAFEYLTNIYIYIYIYRVERDQAALLKNATMNGGWLIVSAHMGLIVKFQFQRMIH